MRDLLLLIFGHDLVLLALLPTLLAYGVVLWAILSWWRKPYWDKAAVPFALLAWWVIDYAWSGSWYAWQQRSLRATPTVALDGDVPHVLLGYRWHSQNLVGLGIRTVAHETRDSAFRRRHDPNAEPVITAHDAAKPDSRSNRPQNGLIKGFSMPRNYLEIRTGEQTRAHQERIVVGYIGFPLELYQVIDGEERLLAVGGPMAEDLPRFPPLPTIFCARPRNRSFFIPSSFCLIGSKVELNVDHVLRKNMDEFLMSALSR